MRYGIRLHDTAPGTLRERLSFAREQGFTCAHIALSKLLPGFKMDDAPTLLSPGLSASVREDFASQGMDCALLGCYLQLARPEGEDLDHVLSIYRAHLRFAAETGISLVGTETPCKGPVFADPLPVSEDAYQLFLANLKKVLPWAAEYGVYLGVEPVFCDIIATPDRAERLLEDAGSDALRIILDGVNLLSNEAGLNPDPVIEEAIRRLGDRVALLHMKDYRLEEGAFRPVSIACGTGRMNYDRLLAFAKRRDLPMTLEDTTPANAAAAREFLVSTAASL